MGSLGTRSAGLGLLVATLFVAAGGLGYDGVCRLIEPTAWLELDRLIGALAECGVALMSGWLALAVSGSMWVWLRASRSAEREQRPAGVPRALHRAIGLALGVTLVLAPSVAQASEPHPTGVSSVSASTPTEPGPSTQGTAGSSASSTAAPSGTGTTTDLGWGAPTTSWVPPAPTKTPQPSTPAEPSVIAQPRAETAEVDEVVVVRGDTLWGIAATHLGAGASNADIAREWPRWYATNRHVIGADPDLIYPGQILTPPN